ncbi:MAG: dTMP kinase [Anaerolineae bacterium]|nr:dTMP kinase [Anaerolineae bacterium]
MATGVFITLEGPDGSGKSSQMRLLVEFLSQKGYQVFATREPGGTRISDQVRQVLLNRMENQEMHPRTETLLFCASRAQLVEEIIRPRLQRGEIVISDRYADSTLAYQGYGHQRELQPLVELLNYTTGGLSPDLTLLLDVDPQTGLSRRRDGGEEWNRLDAYALAFHQRVRQGYFEMSRQQPHRWCTIDASLSMDAVQDAMRVAVLERLQLLVNRA